MEVATRGSGTTTHARIREAETYWHLGSARNLLDLLCTDSGGVEAEFYGAASEQVRQIMDGLYMAVRDERETP